MKKYGLIRLIASIKRPIANVNIHLGARGRLTRFHRSRFRAATCLLLCLVSTRISAAFRFRATDAATTTMSDEVTIDDFPALRLKHVHIKDEVTLLKKINTILQSGTDNLQVVTDFDLTLTKQHINGTHMLSSFGMFRKCKQLPQHYSDEAKSLYEKYRPMEIDPHLSLKEKADAMHDWMIAAHNILKGIEFDPREIEEVAQEFGNALRDGTKEILEKLYNARVPILVFSAGLGDMVEAMLKYNNALFENIKIISNFLKYKENQLDGFSNEVLIHAYNKNECILVEEHLMELEKRQNVLLMGDTTGDAGMVEKIEDTKTVLKIGFLYEHVEASLDSFMEKFDIVLVDDQTMRVPMEILQSIL